MNIYSLVLLAIATACLTTTGNFTYQYFNQKDWKKAIERSYFTVVGVGIFLLEIIILNDKL